MCNNRARTSHLNKVNQRDKNMKKKYEKEATSGENLLTNLLVVFFPEAVGENIENKKVI